MGELCEEAKKSEIQNFPSCASSIGNYHMQRLSLSQGFAHDTRSSDRSSEDAICVKSRISSQGSLAIYCSMLSIRQISNVYGLSFRIIARQTWRKKKENGKNRKIITLNTDYKPHGLLKECFPFIIVALKCESPFILPKVCVKIMNASIAIALVTIFH